MPYFGKLSAFCFLHISLTLVLLLDLRLKFFTTFVLVVIGVTVSISVLRFGVTPSLEDNFVSHLSTSYSSSAEFMAFYGLLNCYLWTMAFVYSPNPNVVAGKLKFGILFIF